MGWLNCRLLTAITYILALAIVVLSCESPRPDTRTAFYHWQTELAIDSLESDWWQRSRAERLYVKFFDVDWDFNRQVAIPKAQLQRTNWPTDADIVPTVFITNRTFQNIDVKDISELANRCWTKIRELWPATAFSEVQLDCDWSGSTRDQFFTFLRAFHEQLPSTTQLSATIRLHQYRYPKQTGIPPVDRGMLMFYNIGDLEDWAEPNSILNLEKAEPYLSAPDYPLGLDVALPLFRWSVLFREGKMIKLLNGLDESQLKTLGFIRDTVANVSYYRVPESQYWQAYYLYEEDYLRPEAVREEQLLAATQLLKNVPTPENGRYLSFYHLDSAVIAPYELNLIENCLVVLDE